MPVTDALRPGHFYPAVSALDRPPVLTGTVKFESLLEPSSTHLPSYLGQLLRSASFFILFPWTHERAEPGPCNCGVSSPELCAL